MSNSVSIVVPIFNNSDTIRPLVIRLKNLQNRIQGFYEVIFVIDGSPDNSAAVLHSELKECGFKFSVIVHSRNFGSFQAIRSGLREANGANILVMSADLQEPIEIFESMLSALESGQCDVALATRTSRDDSLFSKWSSALFWSFYRTFVNKEMPKGGVDIFGCSREFAKALISLPESRTSLIGLVYWLGFKRKEFPYSRQKREGNGKSGWSFSKKLQYFTDSVFSFTNLPVRFILGSGFAWLISSAFFGAVVLLERINGNIEVPGYTTLILLILFTNSLNLIALGIVGTYTWRAYENTKMRPSSIIRDKGSFR